MKRSSVFIGCLSIMLLAVLAVQGLGQAAKRSGEITKLDAAAKSFMVKTSRGETSVLTTDATVIKDKDKTLKFADLKIGDHVSIDGERKGNDVEAKEVLIEAAGATHQH